MTPDPDALRSALASGNYLQVYDHRQNRWLSPDEAVAVIAALAGSEPAGLDVAAWRNRITGAMPWYDESDPDYTELDAVIRDMLDRSDPAGLRDLALVRALIEVDDAWRWVKEYYPVVLTTMPSDLYQTFDRARAALAAIPTASPTACEGCGADDCSALWASQRKCCPDCSHTASPTAGGAWEVDVDDRWHIANGATHRHFHPDGTITYTKRRYDGDTNHDPVTCPRCRPLRAAIPEQDESGSRA